MSARHAPWRPGKFVVFPLGKAKTTQRGGKAVKCWDVRGRVDGYDFSRRFTQPETAAGAQAWSKDLVRAFEAGQWWDPQARAFVDPPSTEEKPATVVDWVLRYWGQMVPEWEPKTRIANHRTLGRAMRGLVRPDAPKPTAGEVAEIEAWVIGDWTTLDTPDYLATWSLPIAAVTHDDLEALLTIYRTKQTGKGTISPATEARTVAVLRACWTQAVARGLIERDPWPAVKTMRKTRRAGKVVKAATGIQQVSADSVLSPAQVWQLAEACATVSDRAGVYRAYIATMGLCGLRPGEAAGLQIGDVELPDEGVGWVIVRRTLRPVADRWLLDGEDCEHGPLKGRDSDSERRVPVPTTLVPVLREHLATYRAGATLDAAVFVSVGGSPIDPSRFKRDVWLKAVATIWPTGPLAGLRRHDLRHAACSMWLQAGTPLKLACTWSGHATLSVFLDVYQGVMPSDEQTGIDRLEAFLAS
jgi:integrase